MSRSPSIMRAVWSLAALALAALFLRRFRTGAALGAASHLLLVLACTQRNSPVLVPWIQRFVTERREVWLTIDDGPAEDTGAILEVLARFDARASFFVIGKRVRQHPGLARRIVAAGHTLENHTDTHPQWIFWTLPACLVRREIERANRTIQRLTGSPPRYFRAPVGMSTPSLHRLLGANWLRPIGWSADGCDGAPGRDLAKANAAILQRLQPGAIVLFHQGGRPDRAAALEQLLGEIYRRGYRCVLPAHDRL